MSVADSFKQYICRACGLIYDEAEGDPDSGLAPGTRFEDIPDDWECPLCGVTKSDFEPFEKKQVVAASAPILFTQEIGVVVLGAGLAGWAVVEALREQDPRVPITLVTACNADRYHKPELSIALSRGLTPSKLIRETGLEAAKRLGVRLMNNTYATGLTPSLHQLRTTRGTLGYTQLVIAQGARPQTPATLEHAQVWRVNDLRAWSALAEALRVRPQKVAIVGAGMVGCELAEDIARAGHEVTIINRDAYPLAHLLPEQAGKRLALSMAKLGISCWSDRSIASLAGEEEQVHVHFSDGSEACFDQVIVATGLHTENRLAEQAGLRFDVGIVVDPNTLRTSVRDIYALGDCISIDGQPCRFIEPIAHQARVIAQSILGKELRYYQHQPPVIRLKTKSLPVVIHGLPSADQDWQTLVDTEDELVMAQYHDGELRAKLSLQVNKAA